MNGSISTGYYEILEQWQSFRLEVVSKKIRIATELNVNGQEGGNRKMTRSAKTLSLSLSLSLFLSLSLESQITY